MKHILMDFRVETRPAANKPPKRQTQGPYVYKQWCHVAAIHWSFLYIIMQ